MPRGSGSASIMPEASKPLISERPQQPAVALRVEQRADADAVAGEHQLPFALIPERHGELPSALRKTPSPSSS